MIASPVPRWLPHASIVLLLAGVVALPARAEGPVSATTQSVVYGIDDRVDYFAISTPSWQTIARESIVALVPSSSLDLSSPGTPFPPFATGTESLSDYIISAYGAPLCANERFAAQPAAAVCSGTLIDDDLVLTAGHCASTLAACQQLSFVFDYYYESDGVLAAIGPEDVYSCAHVLAHAEITTPHLDYAIAQLNRPVTGRTPADVRLDATALPLGSGVVVLGFGSGLPLKFDDGGAVMNPRATSLDVFVASTDTFAGNSGSGVFDDAGRVVGVLVSGADDYVVGPTCTAVNVLGDASARESSTYVFRAVDALCAGGFPSALCPNNPAPSCGDHFCSGGEEAASCATDCAAPHCGDGVCTAGIGETQATCVYDCTSPPLRLAHGRCSVSTSGGEQDGGSSRLLIAWVISACAVLTARSRARFTHAASAS